MTRDKDQRYAGRKSEKFWTARCKIMRAGYCKFLKTLRENRNAAAKHDAEQVVRGLNLLVQYGKEILPIVRDVPFFDEME